MKNISTSQHSTLKSTAVQYGSWPRGTGQTRHCLEEGEGGKLQGHPCLARMALGGTGSGSFLNPVLSTLLKTLPSDVWAVVPFSSQVTGQRWTAFWKAAATRGYHSMFGAYDSKAHSTSSHKENLLAISCVINLFLAVPAPSPLLLRLLPDILGLKHCTAVLSTVLWSTQQHSHLQRIHARDNVHQTRGRTRKQAPESLKVHSMKAGV